MGSDVSKPAEVTDEQINKLLMQQDFWSLAGGDIGWSFGPQLRDFARAVLALATRAPEPQAERTVEVHMDREHGGLAFGPHPDSRGQAREGWKRAVDWLRNNYQDYRTIGDLCDAMLAASPAPDEQRAQAAQEDVTVPLRRLWPLIEKATKGFVFTAARAGEVAADMEAIRTALAGRQQL